MTAHNARGYNVFSISGYPSILFIPLPHLQLVGRVVKERVERVPLLLQPQVVVLRRELLGDDAVLQPPLRLRHDHDVHDHVLR